MSFVRTQMNVEGITVNKKKIGPKNEDDFISHTCGAKKVELRQVENILIASTWEWLRLGTNCQAMIQRTVPVRQ